MDKNQFKRHKHIDRILRSAPDGITLDDLLERLNAKLSDTIQRRQLQNDLHDMKELYGAPISRKRGVGAKVSYEDISYSIVTHELKKNLSDMEEQIEDVKDKSPRLQWLQNLVIMLQDTYFNDPMALEAIDFGDNLEYESSKRVHEFFSYIMNRQVIEVEYYRGFENPIKRIVHPYFVRQYNNRWFLFGWNKQAFENQRPASGILNLPLDRIGKVKQVRIPYKEISIEELKTFKEEYFDDIVGVTRFDNESIHLVMRFEFNSGDERTDRDAKRDFYYLKTKPFYPGIHYSNNKFIEEHGYAEVWMDIIPNKELEWMVLRYADTARIVEPADFRAQINKRVQNIVKKQEE